jgi:hypothetical protein
LFEETVEERSRLRLAHSHHAPRGLRIVLHGFELPEQRSVSRQRRHQQCRDGNELGQGFCATLAHCT